MMLCLHFHILLPPSPPRPPPPSAPGPPSNFTYMATMTSIIFSWLPPVMPNGIITNYRLTVQGRTSVLGPSDRTYLACNLQPGQQVPASISASTITEGSSVRLTPVTAVLSESSNTHTNTHTHTCTHLHHYLHSQTAPALST